MDTLSISTARLILQSVEGHRIVPLETLPFTIGRGADRHLSLGHPQVSRDHAQIVRDPAGFLIRDCGSRHGTFVNGGRISSSHLQTGDRIEFGRTGNVLVFEGDDVSTTRSILSQISEKVNSNSTTSELETLSLFLKAAQALNTSSAANDVLAAMLEHTIRLTGAERGFIFLGESAQDFRLGAGQDHEGGPILEVPAISYSIVRDAAASRSDFILADTACEMGNGRDSIVLHAIQSVVAIPLRREKADSLLGLMYLDSHSSHNDFSSTSRAVLQTIARQGAMLLENLRLVQMEREAALLRRDLEVAASIQQQIIPQSLPCFPFASIHARTIPCTGVGGDFYDVIPTKHGFVAVVADVCGKGIPAGLLASMVQGMLHGQVWTQATPEVPLENTVRALNGFVCSHTAREKYVTLAVLRYTRPPTGLAQVEVVNAGHVAPLIVRASGQCETLTDGDLPVGLIESAEFHSIRLTLSPGDRIVLVSDGITEAENPAGEQFGVEQVQVHLCQAEPLGALFSALAHFCDGVSPQDDQTVLAIECTDTALPGADCCTD